MRRSHAPEVRVSTVEKGVAGSSTPAAARGRRRSDPRIMAAKAATFTLCLVPFGLLLRDALTGGLAADPIEEITHRTGWWALTLLMVTLAVTPVRRLTGWNAVIKLRRMLGLFAFFYATLHVLTYFGLDQLFTFDYMLEDIAERPFITVGFTAWVLMIPLAVTSTRGWVRRLGKRWQKLHRLIYVSAALGVLHFVWQTKADLREPLIYAGVLALLLALRWVPLPPSFPRKRESRM